MSNDAEDQDVRLERRVREELARRDDVIGLQAAATTAREEAARLREQLAEARESLRRRGERITRLLAKVERLEGELDAATRHPARHLAGRVRRRLTPPPQG